MERRYPSIFDVLVQHTCCGMESFPHTAAWASNAASELAVPSTIAIADCGHSGPAIGMRNF